MTAIAQSQERSSIAPIAFVGIVLGIVMLIGYLALPWINQPELGPTTIAQLTAERSNNEFGLGTNGMPLIPITGAMALLAGIWNVFNPKQGRAASIFIALAALLTLLYYVIFLGELGEFEEVNIIGQMAIGFWTVLIAALLMAGQVFIPRERQAGFGLTRVFGNQESVLALALIGLVIIVGLINPRFVSERNVLSILSGNAYIAVAAVGMSMVIISGNIDISIGSLIGVLAIVSGSLAVEGYPIWVSWVAPLFVGGLVGAFIGFLVAFLRIPSIIVTLGMLSILKGGLIFVTQGARITNLPDGYELAQFSPLGIDMPIYFMVALAVIAALWLRYSGTGRAIYAVGGNKEAARLSGISERGIVMRVFIINGVIAGIASVLYATQLSVIQATPPPVLELTIITASVVGGVSILGGTGTVIGSTLAALLLNAIRSGLIFINLSAFWLQAVQGILILVTVLIDLFRRRRQRV